MATEKGAAPPAQRRPPRRGRFSRLRGTGNDTTRGLLLFGALVVFTLLYALLLQWLSSDDSTGVAPQTTPVVANRAAENSNRAGARFVTVDDADSGDGTGLRYAGVWQHIRNTYDGRSEGTSTRSFHVGAGADFRFTGRLLRIYGVTGPNGGYAELRIDGETYALLSFYAPHKHPRALIYTSPALPAGPHAVAIVVALAPEKLPKRRFVNIDGVAYAP